MAHAIVAHTLVAAHSLRVIELARLYDALDRAVFAGGVEGDTARAAHERLAARIVEWTVADVEAEQRDLVTPSTEERDAMRLAIARAIPYAERVAASEPTDSRAQEVLRRLRQLHAAIPTTLARAAQRRFRRSAARLARLEALDAPAFTLDGEARILAAALTSPEPSVPRALPFVPADGFAETFIHGVEACVVLEPGAAGAIDLGLGTSAAVAALAGVSDADRARFDASPAAATLEEPLGRHPLVPRARFCAGRASRLVRAGFESTGPLGWAAGDDVAELARAFDGAAEAHAAFADELRAVAARLTAAGQRGEAVIGLVEYLPRESDGERQWLVAPAGE